MAHFSSAINDIVELQSIDGAVWLYQHITAKVKVGDVLGCGSVVGTENGLPVDQYSTGPHIEVRYCPPGKWSGSIDAWYEPWLNPQQLFATIGSQQAGVVASGSFGAGLTSFFGGGQGGGVPAPVLALAPNADLTNALWVLDDLFIFHNPFDFPVPTFSVFGAEIGDPVEYVHEVFDNIQRNFRALLLRMICATLGVFILYKVTSTWIDYGAIASTATGIVQTAAQGAAFLA